MNGWAGLPATSERERWRAAGDRLWATALADPDVYRRLATAVGGVLDRLRTADDLDALVAMADDLEREVGADIVGAATLVGAACAIRVDELDRADGNGV